MDRPKLPPPFILISYLILIVQWIALKQCSKTFSEDTGEKIEGFFFRLLVDHSHEDFSKRYVERWKPSYFKSNTITKIFTYYFTILL